MHGRKLFTTGTIAALAILAVVAGCREASTGPTSVSPQDFAAKLKLLSGNQQAGPVGSALPEVLSVKVVDAGGLPVAGATVLWQVTAGGGTVNPPAATSASTGIATATWTLGTTLGADSVIAILQGKYALDTVKFSATAKVGPANKFTLSSGNGQTGTVATALPAVLKVNVKDQFGHALAGVKVTWAAALFSGSITPMADSTDSSGDVTASWKLGTSAIAQSATATVTGLTPLVFTATGTPDASRKILMAATTGAGLKDAVGTAINVTATVTDTFANPIKGDAVVFDDLLTGGSTISANNVATDATGKATSVWTLGSRLGEQLLRARVGSKQSDFVKDSATVQFAQVFAGNYFTCGITVTDRTLCWGFGSDGQRGVPSAKTSYAPTVPATSSDTLVGPFQTWRQISAGTSFTCGIDVARQLYCWGRLANSAQVNVPTQRVLVGKTLSFASVSTSDTHSCVLATSGLLACTGSNARGQLGDGTQVDQSSGTYVIAGVSSDSLFASVATGGSHTCAFLRYNPADSANTKMPRCWGGNGSGQLGRSTISTTGLAVLPITMPSTSVRFDSTSLVAGNAHTCVLTDANSATPGVAYCWGSNGYGQLGKAPASIRDSVPVPVTTNSPPAFVRLYAGEYHTCGISAAGATWCWGRNDSGQLGLGSASTTALPTAIAGVTFRQLALGELHSCGVVGTPSSNGGTQSTAGEIRCWGDSEYGQVGTGASSGNGAPILTPRKVNGQP